MTQATVLAIDDDAVMQEQMRQHLEREGYRFLALPDSNDILQNMEEQNPDIIVLSLPPSGDHIELLSSIRSKSRAGLIIVSSKCETIDRIIGLEMGADDFLKKPFELRELAARIKALLRRVPPDETTPLPLNDAPIESPLAQAERIVFGNWVLDRLQYQLFDAEGKTAELTSGEFKLLEALVLAPHRALSRQYLFETTHHANFPEFDRAIDIQIGRLRKKMNDDPHNPTLLKTIRGVGYMFVGEPKAG